MMWGWPENAFSWTTSSSLSVCRVTMSPILERTSSNAELRSATEVNFGWETTRIIANCPERIVQVESSILHPCSKRIRLTSATIPGLSLSDDANREVPYSGILLPGVDFGTMIAWRTGYARLPPDPPVYRTGPAEPLDLFPLFLADPLPLVWSTNETRNRGASASLGSNSL
jgi:hypothetical protein